MTGLRLESMDEKSFVLWVHLLAAGLILVVPSASITASPGTPFLIECVFLHHFNVTCKWIPGDPQVTHYTLNVERKSRSGRVKQWTCTSSNTSCTVGIEHSSVNFNFCVSVMAHSPDGNKTFRRQCEHGVNEVMLPPVNLSSITPVEGKPRCLTLSWTRILEHFAVSKSPIQEGKLESQIEFRAQGQPGVYVHNVKVTGLSFVACVFRADTVYSVRLRHRYQSSRSPWSQWSNTCLGRTGEDAPSSAPMFWRQVTELHRDGYRLASLLWKPLPHSMANGRILFYNVSCQSEDAQILQDKGSCRHMSSSHTSCSLRLPLGRCSCSLSASTSVGASPKTWIWFNGASRTEPPALSQLTVAPVDDNSLKIQWAPASTSSLPLSGFVVEWFVVRQENNGPLHWKRLNSSNTMTIIKDEVEPFKQYAVSVRGLFGDRGAGQSKTVYDYTRQGAPSAGPKMQVQTVGSTLKLSWTLPVEQCHGFIRNYTLYYKTSNQPANRVVLPSDVEHYTLQLSPGHYDFFMQASTEAGVGVIGPSTSVHIGSEELSVMLVVILPIALISLLLIVMICAIQNKIALKKLCHDIPDPSNSSLAHWSPKSTMVGGKELEYIKYSDVVLLCDREMDIIASDQDLSNKSICYLQTYSSPVIAPIYHTYKCKPTYTQSHKGATETVANFTSCPSIYSSVLVPPSSVSQQSIEHHHSAPSVRYSQLQPEGASEQQTRDSKTTSYPFVVFSHQQAALPFCVGSPQHILNHFTSVPLLQPNAQDDPHHQNTPIPRLPFLSSLFVDLSPSPMEVDPYLPV